jgi:hypothetical protein
MEGLTARMHRMMEIEHGSGINRGHVAMWCRDRSNTTDSMLRARPIEVLLKKNQS